ncbi:MAG: SDR family oxidoreductase [Methylophilaceae bacterium]
MYCSRYQRIYKDSLYNGVTISSPAVYSASKAGVIGLMKFLSSYWGKSNIRVNSISPGGG